jgi:hypothetical protein
MARHYPDLRTITLVNALSAEIFKSPPRGVGLKTLIIGRMCGLIELSGDIRRPACRLTQKGLTFRQSLRRAAEAGRMGLRRPNADDPHP